MESLDFLLENNVLSKFYSSAVTFVCAENIIGLNTYATSILLGPVLQIYCKLMY